MDRAEISRQQRARLVCSAGDTEQGFRFLADGVSLAVASLTVQHRAYIITLDPASGALRRCTCPDCAGHLIACKHLWIAHYTFKRPLHFEPVLGLPAMPMPPPLPAMAAAPEPRAVEAEEEDITAYEDELRDAASRAMEAVNRTTLRHKVESPRSKKRRKEELITAAQMFHTARLSMPM